MSNVVHLSNVVDVSKVVDWSVDVAPVGRLTIAGRAASGVSGAGAYPLSGQGVKFDPQDDLGRP